MSADNDRESGGFGIDVQLSQIVEHVNGNAADLKYIVLWQFARPSCFVDVAANNGDGGDGRKPVEDLGRAYVAGMNDAFAAAQGFDGLRPQQAVRVGDDSD